MSLMKLFTASFQHAIQTNMKLRSINLIDVLHLPEQSVSITRARKN